MRNSWTGSELDQLEKQVSNFEFVAFKKKFDRSSDRKKAIKAAARVADDQNIRFILGGSIDYLLSRPELVNAAISKARDHIATLRANGPRLN
ncbi:hypothetical protein [Sulfitobacter guttiformis]|uniref:Uncharacterized protein n=1 Tax=Sulfitobacter guttiformis TaxID=74349 RepID=A0A420DNW1_9RHOB|nr:hypothetical protein [Sulfitobacter guttiformis]RKE95942.1 hypothetical protein C8N30_0489 [Sulfitobacter guttiformis]